MLESIQHMRHSLTALQKNIDDYQRSTTSLSQQNPNTTANKSCTFIAFLQNSWTLIQALFVRIIYILSSVAAVWRVVKDTKDDNFWYLLLLLIFLVLESYITVYGRKGYEYKWCCPSAFAYLITVIPCIWLLELHHSNRLSSLPVYISLHSPNDSVSSSTLLPFIPSLSTMPSTETTSSFTDQNTTYNRLFLNYYNETSLSHNNSTNQSMFSQSSVSIILARTFMDKYDIKKKDQVDLRIEELLKRPQKFILKLDTQLSIEEWRMITEQMTLLVLIVSRWLLPKGELSREELSQLLLVYIGIAADIIEFFEVFKEKRVRTNFTLSILVLVLWTLSLLQFCIALTASRGRKSRLDLYSGPTRSRQSALCCSPSDFWGMLMSLLLQDMPFFCFRAVLIFHYHILSYSSVFFTCKNGLIIILQFYRITVIICSTFNYDKRLIRDEDPYKLRKPSITQSTVVNTIEERNSLV